ncbi:hypothetical protein [Actinoplanes sp. NBRC 101535]|uniref:hypothetical protein n=1 Tax=Actinoplanes sp. NBRC 101535 TaxID=3032196 RepID=UPI0024A4C6AE|nr:hypothetical protein [Actinoplanes sp. NBRC 101535]GLY07168.1 hypothetical protein Acsp01_75470 [Actinoplanes sp. NBRC 101535]
MENPEDVPWDEILATAYNRPTGDQVLSAMRAGWYPEHIAELFLEDADYHYTEWGTDCGYVPGVARLIPFLARMAADDAVAAVEAISEIMGSPLEPVGITDADLDAKVDGLHAAVQASRPLLEEAARRVPEVRDEVERLLGGDYAGAFPLEWRGKARPFFRAPWYRDLGVADGRLTVGALVLDPATGDDLSPPPEPPPTGLHRLTRAWRTWRTPPPPYKALAERVRYTVDGHPFDAVAAGRQILRTDASTGEPVGEPLRGHRRSVYTMVVMVLDGRPVLFSSDGGTILRWDAETGVPWPIPPVLSPPSAG